MSQQQACYICAQQSHPIDTSSDIQLEDHLVTQLTLSKCTAVMNSSDSGQGPMPKKAAGKRRALVMVQHSVIYCSAKHSTST